MDPSNEKFYIDGRRALALTLVAWGVTVLVALTARPILPSDETRYIATAWEMWVRGDWLVPYLGGVPHSHKPPLFFWLMLVGWKAVGPTLLSARLISPIAGLASLVVVHALSRQLWPNRQKVAYLAPMLTQATLVWASWTTLVMFDVLLSATILIALLGLVIAGNGRSLAGWSWFALGVGLALLAKGPVAFVYTVPPILLAPLWARRPSWLRWFGAAGASLVLAAVPLLLWALAAARAGGEEFARELFVTQTVGRIGGGAEFNVHVRPMWWFLALLPLITLPLSLSRSFWTGLFGFAAPEGADSGLRFCRCVFFPALVIFSVISGKQAHYLVPALPILALATARVWKAGDE